MTESTKVRTKVKKDSGLSDAEAAQVLFRAADSGNLIVAISRPEDGALVAANNAFLQLAGVGEELL